MNNHSTQQKCTAGDVADKIAVAETLYRFAAGIDLRDKELLAAVLALDSVSDFTREPGSSNVQPWTTSDALAI
jgi:hypothetical protein